MNDQFFFFFGEEPFSQWTFAEFVIEGITYNSTEQWMMAEKARLFEDDDKLSAILETDDPREQKQLGRNVRGFHKEKWERKARDIVYEGNHAKFSQNAEMREQLIATYPRILVEASPYDKIWGIGLNAFQASITPPEEWPGLNWLGEILTELREDMMRASNV
jgi:ribA/ribD-fused uncharacterized protein